MKLVDILNAIIDREDENRKEIRKLYSIIKEIEKVLKDNYGGLSISDYDRLIDLCKRRDEK